MSHSEITYPLDDIQPAPLPPPSRSKAKGLDTSNVNVDPNVDADMDVDVEMGNNEVGVNKDRNDGRVVDAVWGTIDDDGPNYRNLGWIRASVLEVKTQIGLGVLGLPAVLATLGYVPGIIVIVVIALIITWSDYVVGTFKMNHPEVYTVADVGQLLFGPIGREILGFAYWIEVVATAGAGFLSISVAFNTITSHATCTVVWAVVGAVLVGLISAIQTLDRISWLGWVGLVSILSAVITLTAAVGVSDRPSLAPPGDFLIETRAFGNPTFLEGMQSVAVVVFAYAGTPNFFNIVGEMRMDNPDDYTKSVIVSQTFITTVYLIIACTVYHFVGQYISSPALGSAGLLMKKICYGLALPGLIVGGMLFAHVAAKYVFVRILRNSRHLAKNTPVHYAVWYGCVILTCLIGFIIAESIPFFNDLLSLIGALLATVICIQMEAYMWIWDNFRPIKRTTQWWCLICMNVAFFIIGTFIMITGTIGAVKTIHKNLQDGNTSSPFSCADNSGN